MPLRRHFLGRSARVVATGFVALAALGLSACSGPFPQSTLDPTSGFGTELHDLFGTIFWWAVFVFVVVETLLVYTVIRFRSRPGQEGEPKHVHGHTTLEIAWTLAPAVILVFIAVPTIRTIFMVDGTPEAGALQVEVIGHQWWWEYRYPELGIVTANELHLPVDGPVSLSMTSADVIHSFWAPRLGGKRDLIQGRTTRLALTPDSVGMYMGQCAEYCGTSHANMRLRVFVDTEDDFDAWVAQQQTTPPPPDSLEGLVRRGAEVFSGIREPANHSCLVCHTVQGLTFGAIGPNLTHVGSRTTIAGGILPNTPEGLRRWLSNPPGEKPGELLGRSMPKIDLSQEEIDALVAFLQSLR
jgi:cytochrome c oxidase subunit 2